MSVDTQSVPNVDALVGQLRQRTRRLLVGFTSVTLALAASVACLAFLVWKKAKAIDKALEDRAFSQFQSDYNASTDLVVPQVNTIQFLHHGYSIIFNSVNYTQEGLSLTGTVGNPTELWISSLALKFTARPYPYQLREKWHKGYIGGFFLWWSSDWDIGTGQTSVGSLNPGSSAFFSVNIPNVKQTSDPIQIEVTFNGERYSYLK